MKKLILTIFLIAACSICAFAQIAPKTADWQYFAPEKEEFAIEFPASPENAKYERSDFQRRYYAQLNGTYFFISSDPLKKPAQFDFVMRFVGRFNKTGETDNNGKTATQKFVFTDTDDYHHTVITAKTKNRVYVFQTISPNADDALADRFFANLKLTEKPLEKSAAEDSKTTLRGDRILPTTINAENGSGSNAGSSVERMAAVPLAQRVTAPLTLLSKPRANYTDLARFYQITGDSALKVTFLTNGEIGSITVVSKLPFELTTNAVEAARKIRFEPAVRNGQPIAVSKIVQYSFSIY